MKILLILTTILFLARGVFAYDDAYYERLLEEISQSVEQGDEESADFYMARYMGASFMDEETERDVTDLYPMFGVYKVSKPTSLISGKYSPDFIEWFIVSSYVLWGRGEDEDTDEEDRSCVINSCSNGKYFATVIGSPYLEGWSVSKDGERKTAVLAQINHSKKPYIVVVRAGGDGPDKIFEKKELDLDGHNIQYMWYPEFHDLDGDGDDELWLRYNKAWADGFSQELAIYRIGDNGPELIRKFEGLAEGIARRLDGNMVEVGHGTFDKPIGHLDYDRHILEVWQYKDGDFVKVSEKKVPHILRSDKWREYYL